MLLTLDGRSLAAHLEHPLFAVAPPRWYTRQTQALAGGVFSRGVPERSTGRSWRSTTSGSRGARPRCSPSAIAASAFVASVGRVTDAGPGDAIHKVEEDTSPTGFRCALGTEYYDFPHTLFLHFFRTGDLTSLRTAIEGRRAPRRRRHRAQGDSSRVRRARHARAWPSNHWVRYSNGLFVTGGWAFYKNEDSSTAGS